MTFAVIIGGLGTMEGPIVGSVLYVIIVQIMYNYPVCQILYLVLSQSLLLWLHRMALWELYIKRPDFRFYHQEEVFQNINIPNFLKKSRRFGYLRDFLCVLGRSL